jgi:Na+/H+ antiporter NhaD/arsenite permease-like protein
MTTPAIIGLVIFILGYVGITLEHKVHVNKAAFALLSGTILWVLIGIVSPTTIHEHIVHAGFDIFEVTLFLLGAMSLVEILIHYRIFDIIRDRILAKNLSLKAQFFVITGLAFVVSAFIANMVATIILIQIARRFFWGKNLLVASVAIVFATNAGGAFSPIGDVTSIMLWIAGKFSSAEILIEGFLPALCIGIVSTLLLSRKITSEDTIHAKSEPEEHLTRGELIIVLCATFSFLLPIIAKMLGVPPVIGMLFGVGFTWLVVDLVKGVSSCRTHLTASIENLVQKTDIASIKFFVGILLAVSALSALGVLDYISQFIYGSVQTTPSIIWGNILIGLISALLDNIPLTAIAIDILHTTNTSLWVLLSLTVGTGGSLLPIGSAAGVVAMGMLKELTFKEYVRIGFVPALVSFFVGVGVWGLQAFVL